MSCLQCSVNQKYNTGSLPQRSRNKRMALTRAADMMCCVCGRLSGKQHQICFSQGSAATLFKWGKWVQNFLMWNFLRIVLIKNYKNRFILPSYSNIKRGTFLRHSVCNFIKHKCSSHTRTVVRECFKGDEASQWIRPKFDPSPHQNPLTDLHLSLIHISEPTRPY